MKIVIAVHAAAAMQPSCLDSLSLGPTLHGSWPDLPSLVVADAELLGHSLG
jgi:hypothetical protein